MTDTKQPEALRLADQYRSHGGIGMSHFDHIEWASQAEYCLRVQQERIAELEAEISALKGELEAIGAGGVTGLRDRHDGALWCVHVYGPDDIHAMPSRAAAFEEANGLNEIYAQTKWDEYTPIMTAVVEPWPHSPDTHAADVALLLQCQANRAAIAQEGGK